MQVTAFHAVPPRFRLCALLLIGTLLCVPGHAGELRGPYIGASLHRATLHFDSPLGSGPPDFNTLEFKGRDTALGLLAGYRIADWFAAEAKYFSVSDAGTGSSAAEFSALTAVAAAIWPVGSLDLYGKAGLGYWKSQVRYDEAHASSRSSTYPVAGVGVQHRFGRLALRADLDVVMLRFLESLGSAPRDGGSVKTFSVGVVWRFE